MQKSVSAIALVIIHFLSGCEPAATFNKPQPEGGKQRSTLPHRLHGQYLSADSQLVVIITGKLVAKRIDGYFKEHKDSLDDQYVLVGDTLYDKVRGTKEMTVVDGDSVQVHAVLIDTLFDVKNGDVLNKFRGHYFLNAYYDDTTWEVTKLSLRKGILTLAIIDPTEDLRKLQTITETSDDTITTYFALKRYQFKAFLKEKGFGCEQHYVRLPTAHYRY